MATTLPPHIEELVVVFQDKGVPISRVVTRRSDLEDLQFDYDGSWRTYTQATISDAAGEGREDEIADIYPIVDFGLTPYLSLSFFDPGVCSGWGRNPTLRGFSAFSTTCIRL
jgi:hypothetical protein